MRKNWMAIAAIALLGIAGCNRPGQNFYQQSEVGQASAVSFGTVVGAREVGIIGERTGAGAVLGGASGAAIGTQIGGGTGQAVAIGGMLIAGAIAGAVAEQTLRDGTGVEYVVVLESGVTLTIVQEKAAGDRVLAAGERVMLQNTGGLQRVLPASHLPTVVQRPQGIRVKD